MGKDKEEQEKPPRDTGFHREQKDDGGRFNNRDDNEKPSRKEKE